MYSRTFTDRQGVTVRAALVMSLVAGLVCGSAASATEVTLTIGGQLALQPGDAVADLHGYDCCGGSLTAIGHDNGSRRASSSNSWTATTLAYALTLAYPVPTGDGFLPSSDEIFVIETSDNGLYKLRQKVGGTNTGAGIQLEYEYLGSSVVPAPVASFTYTTYDIVGFFTDTSSGGATGWSWDFDDGSSPSTAQSPRHVFTLASASGDFSVALTASNSGGDDTTSQTVTVTKRTSTYVPPGGSRDFDGDGVADLQLYTPGCGAEMPNAMQTINGAGYAQGGDYRTASLAEAQAASYQSGGFCHPTADLENGFFLSTSAGSLVKLWFPENDAVLGARFEAEVLSSGLPEPPDSAFSWSSVDLIVDFADASTGSASVWSWDFGDGDTGIGATPTHVFHDPGDYTVCLTASNVGGPDPTPDCQTVSVAEVPSTLYGAGTSIDLDSFGPDDLLIDGTAACGAVPQRMVPLAGAAFGVLAKPYDEVTLADALALSYSASPACPPVSRFDSPFVVRTGALGYVRMWIPQSDERGARLVFEVLQQGQDAIFASGFEAGSTAGWTLSP